jgi:hypothetical protein
MEVGKENQVSCRKGFLKLKLQRRFEAVMAMSIYGVVWQVDTIGTFYRHLLELPSKCR